MMGIARVINYSGIVRGATQRLTKLEISKKPNDDLILYLTKILTELQTSEVGSFELKKLEDEDFQESLVLLEEIWYDLLIEIENTRILGYEQTNIITVSEKHFRFADNSVGLAESYSDNLLEKYTLNKFILISSVLFLTLLLIALAVKLYSSNKENKRIERLSHIDLPTGLPNKSKCEQKFAMYGTLGTHIQYGLIMFDLNNLKQTNDILGHHVGDALILELATLLKNHLIANTFAARFGGDEFIIIYDDVSESEILSFIDAIRCDATIFNTSNEKYKISFAVGYALSDYRENIDLSILFQEADKNMYIDKQSSKKNFESTLSHHS